jgi:hypothetical protein
MATTSTSTTIAAVEPVFTDPERLALAGFQAGYTGLTRAAPCAAGQHYLPAVDHG